MPIPDAVHLYMPDPLPSLVSSVASDSSSDSDSYSESVRLGGLGLWAPADSLICISGLGAPVAAVSWILLGHVQDL